MFPNCEGQIRLIAFITHKPDIRQILNHIGVKSELPHISPARGPPLWEGCDAQRMTGCNASRTGQLNGMGQHNCTPITVWNIASIGD